METLYKVESLRLAAPSPTEIASWRIVHPYPALPNFTGRRQERALLSEWLTEDTRHPLLVLRALGGFGKSALTWHWLHHDVDEQQWPRVFWWSFYEQNARMESFLRALFHYIRPTQPLPSNNHELLQTLAFFLQKQPTLIILDGFERELRAYGTMGAAYLGDIIPSGIGHETLNFEDRRKLVEHLLAIPSMADVASRVTIIDQLPDEIKANVPNHSVARTHILNLVNTCLQYPNGMQELRDILQFFEHNSIPMQQFEQSLTRLLPKESDSDRNNDRVLFQGNERDCISPLAESFLRLVTMLRNKSKVLMTTRLLPRSLQRHRHLVAGCREEELTALTPADAVTLFRRQGITGARHEIEEVGQRVGYHPLSLRLLAGAIMEDWRQPGDIRVAQQLKVSHDLIQNRHHVLEHAYNSLSPRSRRLLNTLACFRSPVEVTTLDKLFALRALLMVRSDDPTTLINTALTAAQQALVFADEWARTHYPVERDYVGAYWLLGAAQRVKGNLVAANMHLTEALTRCRGINAVYHEAEILLEMARLRVAQGKQAEGRRLAEEALH